MFRLTFYLLLISLYGCEQSLTIGSQPTEQLTHKLVGSLFVEQPEIRSNPVRRAPLVAIVDIEASTPVTAILEITDGENTWEIPGPKESATDFQMVAHSMRPGRTHTIHVRLTNPNSKTSEVSEPLEFRTPQLPDSFPPLEVILAKASEVEPGVLLFPVNLWRDDNSVMDYGYLIALNEKGEVIWFLHSGHRTADVRRIENGHILFQHGNYRYAFEVDLLGNLVRQWHGNRLTVAPSEKSIPVDVDTIHHEIVEHPNGNLFTLSTDLVKFDKFPTSVVDPGADWEPAHVVCDQLIEFEPKGGEVVRRIELKDFLDQSRFSFLSRGGFWKPKYNKRIKGYSRDWSHANALLLLPGEDAVIVSFRHQDCLMKIDLKNEKILWIFGTHDGWGKEWQKYLLKPVGENFAWPYHQHGPQITRDGLLRLYDNGNFRARPFERKLLGSENKSRVVEYQIDEKTKTVRQVWEYDGSPDDQFFCPFYCEADLMPETGNYLITDGGHIELEDGTPYNEIPGKHQWARIFEIKGKAPHEKVFEVKFESPLKSPHGWSIYRSTKLKSLNEISVDYSLITEKSTSVNVNPEKESETELRERSKLVEAGN